jgi:4-hydroxy-3-methylbut-2-enyl diphosphate reductase
MEVRQVEGGGMVITAHGVGPGILSLAKERRLRVIDTTCPIVCAARKAIQDMVASDFDIVIFGEEGHSEVAGLLGWAQNRGRAVLDTEALRNSGWSARRLGIISQTTQSYLSFAGFASRLVADFSREAGEIRVINTLCRETCLRQEEAARMAGRNELMIVVGDHASANTSRLLDICSAVTEAHLVETAGEVDISWIVDKHRIGIVSGTSAPDEIVDEVVTYLESL